MCDGLGLPVRALFSFFQHEVSSVVSVRTMIKKEHAMKRQTVFTGTTLVTGIVVFALLMAIRAEFSMGWARMLIAGIAFGVLAVVLGQVRKRSL